MQAPFEMTEGRRRLEEIITAFPSDSHHWNEAQNCFQFVDRLLTECLGWEHPYIEVELFDDLGGRADYLLGKPAKAVLEAKREAKLFDALPAGKPTVVRKLQPLIQACKNFEDAIIQVIPYCSILRRTDRNCLQWSATCNISSARNRRVAAGRRMLFVQWF